MINPISKVGPFLDYQNLGALFHICLSLVNVLELVQLSIGYMPVNIELAKFV